MRKSSWKLGFMSIALCIHGYASDPLNDPKEKGKGVVPPFLLMSNKLIAERTVVQRQNSSPNIERPRKGLHSPLGSKSLHSSDEKKLSSSPQNKSLLSSGEKDSNSSPEKKSLSSSPKTEKSLLNQELDSLKRHIKNIHTACQSNSNPPSPRSSPQGVLSHNNSPRSSSQEGVSRKNSPRDKEKSYKSSPRHHHHHQQGGSSPRHTLSDEDQNAFLIGKALFERQEYNEAIEFLNKVKEKNSQHQETRSLLCEVYLAQRELEKAKELLFPFIQPAGEPEDLYNYGAACELSSKEEDKLNSSRYFKSSAQQGYLPALLKMAQISKEQGDYPKAMRYLNNCIRLESPKEDKDIVKCASADSPKTNSLKENETMAVVYELLGDIVSDISTSDFAKIQWERALEYIPPDYRNHCRVQQKLQKLKLNQIESTKKEEKSSLFLKLFSRGNKVISLIDEDTPPFASKESTPLTPALSKEIEEQAQALWKQGFDAYLKEQKNIAKNYWQQALALYPDHLFSKLSLANHFKEEEELGKAEDILRTVGEENLMSNYNLGEVKQMQGETEEMIKLYKKAIEEGSAQAAIDLGIYYRQTQQPKEAHKYLHMAELLGKGKEAFVELGHLSYEEKDYPTAVKYWRQAFNHIDSKKYNSPLEKLTLNSLINTALEKQQKSFFPVSPSTLNFNFTPPPSSSLENLDKPGNEMSLRGVNLQEALSQQLREEERDKKQIVGKQEKQKNNSQVKKKKTKK